MENTEPLYLLSAAIDFGTTYSGLAYSYQDDQETIHVVTQWSDGTVANKIPTAILFDRDCKFVAFGQEAIEAYDNISDEEEETEYFYFHRFKMNLHKEKCITKTLQLRDITGKTMKAIDVFSTAIKYLKDYLISTIQDKNLNCTITEEKIKWVLTVPAIWDVAAKKFMREAAERAGITSGNLQLALEPEAASLCCLKTPREKMVCSHDDISSGELKYLLVDSGGGTVDITAHERNKNNELKELYKASGGALGGTKVDEKFTKYLSTLFSNENISHVQTNHPFSWIRIMQGFESKKKSINRKNKQKSFTLPILQDVFNYEFFKDLTDDDRKNAQLKSSKLIVSKEVIEEMISDVSEKITKYVTMLLQKPELCDVKCIMMVGGFSNASTLVEKMKYFAERNGLNVLVPEDAELAVVKGAVLFGWRPDTIQVRRCRKTYGYETLVPFVEGKDPEHLMKPHGGKKYCEKFVTLVRANQNVSLNHVETRSIKRTDVSFKKVSVSLYASDNEIVSYCDEEGVIFIGNVLLAVPHNDDEKVKLRFSFGSTEFRVEAIDKVTGNVAEGSFEFIAD